MDTHYISVWICFKISIAIPDRTASRSTTQVKTYAYMLLKEPEIFAEKRWIKRSRCVIRGIYIRTPPYPLYTSTPNNMSIKQFMPELTLYVYTPVLKTR